MTLSINSLRNSSINALTPSDSRSHSNELLKRALASSGPGLTVFEFLSPSDGARVAPTSESFYKGASERFRQLLKKDINRNKIKRPIRYFKKHPESRELYIKFDQAGVEYIANLMRRKLPNYSIYTKITLLHTATNIDKLIAHLNAQITEHSNVDIDINDFNSLTKRAIESFRTVNEVNGLPMAQVFALLHEKNLNRADIWSLNADWQDAFDGLSAQQANALSLRCDLSRDDVEELSDSQAYALGRNNNLNRADVQGLFYTLAYLLGSRHDFNRSDVEGLSDSQAYALEKNRNLTLDDVKGLEGVPVKALGSRHDLNRADVAGLSDRQAEALIYRPDLNPADVAGLSDSQASTLLSSDNLSRASVEGSSDSQFDDLKSRYNIFNCIIL